MIISYCLNPNCTSPKNHPKLKICNACGWNLILYNRYRVIKQIGQGGFGATFMGVDLTITGNPLCVVKQLRPAAENPEALKMALDLFKREAKTLEKIDHPQIPKLLNYFVDNRQFYLIQTLVKGKNLRVELKANGVFSEIAAKNFLAEMLPVIHYIHSQKVIHRDIKPANILRREKDNKLILIDFGAVKDQVNTELAKTYGNTALTKFAVGTMGFAPPEQMAMRPIYASDIYALGATCIYLLTGKSPKDIPRDQQTGRLIWQKEIQVSASFGKVLQTMLEPDVRQRYRTAKEVMDALDIIPFESSLSNNLMSKATYLGANDNLDISTVSDSQVTAANSSVTQKLQEAVEERKNQQKNVQITWNKQTFLTAYQNGKKDFSEQVIGKLDLEGINLSKCLFRHSNLDQIILSKANLYMANFFGASVKGANLKGANLRKAYFNKCDLQNSDLQGANLTRANLTNANLDGVNLCNANLENAEIDLKQLEKVKTNWGTIFPDGSRKWWKVF